MVDVLLVASVVCSIDLFWKRMGSIKHYFKSLNTKPQLNAHNWVAISWHGDKSKFPRESYKVIIWFVRARKWHLYPLSNLIENQFLFVLIQRRWKAGSLSIISDRFISSLVNVKQMLQLIHNCSWLKLLILLNWTIM